jgi:hypothetical protein
MKTVQAAIQLVYIHILHNYLENVQHNVMNYIIAIININVFHVIQRVSFVTVQAFPIV